MPYKPVVPEGATVDIAYLLDQGMKAVVVAGQANDRALLDQASSAADRSAAACGLIAAVLDPVAAHYGLARTSSYDNTFLADVPAGEMAQVKAAAANLDIVAAGHHAPDGFGDDDNARLSAVAENLYAAYFGDIQRLAHPLLPAAPADAGVEDLATEFRWPWVPESDFSDEVGAWPRHRLKGVARDEAVERIEALVGDQIRNLSRARAAMWFWGHEKLEVPAAERPAADDPRWESRAMAALGRAAMRDELVRSYDWYSEQDEDETEGRAPA